MNLYMEMEVMLQKGFPRSFRPKSRLHGSGREEKKMESLPGQGLGSDKAKRGMLVRGVPSSSMLREAQSFSGHLFELLLPGLTVDRLHRSS